MGLIDYYRLLDIPEDATESDITYAFRKLARIYHPDVNPDSSAEQKFKDIYLAYSVLTDPLERRKYDEQLAIERRKCAENEFSHDPFPNFRRPYRRGKPYFGIETEISDYNIIELERPADNSPSSLRRNLILHITVILIFIFILWIIFKLTLDPEPTPPRSFFRVF
jgi:curved DNA-binding protein CbpA